MGALDSEPLEALPALERKLALFLAEATARGLVPAAFERVSARWGLAAGADSLEEEKEVEAAAGRPVSVRLRRAAAPPGSRVETALERRSAEVEAGAGRSKRLPRRLTALAAAPAILPNTLLPLPLLPARLPALPLAGRLPCMRASSARRCASAGLTRSPGASSPSASSVRVRGGRAGVPPGTGSALPSLAASSLAPIFLFDNVAYPPFCASPAGLLSVIAEVRDCAS
jgi:hypothetical protein